MCDSEEIIEVNHQLWAEDRLRPLNNKALDDLNDGSWHGAAFNYAQGVQDAMRALGVEP